MFKKNIFLPIIITLLASSFNIFSMNHINRPKQEEKLTIKEFNTFYGDNISKSLYKIEDLRNLKEALCDISINKNNDLENAIKDSLIEAIDRQILIIEQSKKQKPSIPTNKPWPIKQVKIPESCTRPIENQQINTLINELKKEISPNFDLKIINPCLGSIEILVSGYEKDLEDKTKESYAEILSCLYKKGNIGSKNKDLIQIFSKECINYFSNTHQNIIFTGFGSGNAHKEFATIFSIFLNNRIDKIIIQDIHLIDSSYYLIDPIYKDSKEKTVPKNKIMIDQHMIHQHINQFKDIIYYVYLLNKKLKTNKNSVVKLFFHENEKCYLKCISECNLNKTNCLSVWFIPTMAIDLGDYCFNIKKSAEDDLINLIKNGTHEKCLFLRKGEERINPKILNPQTKDQYIKDRLEIIDKANKYNEKANKNN